ncbi:MAG TPA: hypothetical protein VGO00_23005 [Kofleriaceae bacterium]|nr:hypothetical protein [Kofleriaceae bacterium]
MALITDFYVAPASEASKILDGTGTKNRSSYLTKSLDTVKLESLEKILAKRGSKLGGTKIVTDQEAEQWVFVVSPSLVALLAKLSDVDAVAKKWAATPELKADGFTVALAKQAIRKLATLAAEAATAKQQLLLMMSL